MSNILIISGSVRKGRMSHRVAKYFEQYIKENDLASCEILDLADLSLPILEERLRLLDNPPTKLAEAAEKVKKSDGIIIVSPEYNGGYPAALKNFIDSLYDEWYRKPIAIAAVSSGPFGGSQVIMQLVEVLWKMRALMVPGKFHVASVQQSYAEDGTPTDKAASDKNAAILLKELLWCMGKA